MNRLLNQLAKIQKLKVAGNAWHLAFFLGNKMESDSLCGHSEDQITSPLFWFYFVQQLMDQMYF